MITIDSEFKSLIPPLTPEEYAGLEASIIKEGCRDALIIWDGTLIDGHNRYEMCIKHEIEYDTSELVFNSRDDAIDWIYQNQLSRRNLTDNNIRYLRGKQYEHRKKTHGGNHGNQYTKVTKTQTGPSGNTAQNLAEEHGVSKNTIKRDAEYARAVDTLARDYGEEEKQKIISKNSPRGCRRMVDLQGQRAVYNGQTAEDIIASILQSKGYNFSRQETICKSIYGHKLRGDFLISNFKGFPQGLIIESKWQQVSGSNDEKFPYLVRNIMQQYPCPAIIIVDGNGHKPGAIKWLAKQVDKKQLLGVFTISEFLRWVNNQR